MRIGIMLRSYDEIGGIGVYTRNLVPELLRIDQKNHYVLFYRNPENLGLFAHHENVTERVIKANSKVSWDQLAVPYQCWKEKLDVIFHPKFTAPLLAPCKVAMVVHGADWFITEQAKYYPDWDVKYMRFMTPLYFKKCAVVLSVSQLTTDNFNNLFKLPPDKVRTVYFGPARHFRRISDENVLQEVKARYNLPEKFILTLTKRNGDGRKNLSQIFKAYEWYHGQVERPYKLIIGGKDCHLYREEYAIPNDGYGRDIIFPGWVAQEDLPAVYSLADLYLYPSNLEAFPIPITEAMACGTPILTSDANGLREIAGDAAVLVDQNDTRAIACGIERILSSPSLQASLIEKGLARSAIFTWDKCARKTLAIIESLAG